MKSKNEQIKRTKFFTRLAIVKREFGLSKKGKNNFTDRWKKEFKDTKKSTKKAFSMRNEKIT